MAHVNTYVERGRGASARSLLLTVLGEFVLPGGRSVWTSAFVQALALLQVEEKAARQALARTAAAGWITSARRGRRTAWELTAAGRRLLSEGAERIYSFGSPAPSWDGRWLIVLASVPEGDRQARHLVRTRLAWSGLGNLLPGVWVGAHPDRGGEVRAVLDRVGLTGTAISFVGRLGEIGEPRRIAEAAWDLPAVERRYEEFLDDVRRLRPRTPAQTLAAQLRLVQEWRRLPFLDPGLPAELLPRRWNGARAAAVFRERHDRWQPGAQRAWGDLVDQGGDA